MTVRMLYLMFVRLTGWIARPGYRLGTVTRAERLIHGYPCRSQLRHLRAPAARARAPDRHHSDSMKRAEAHAEGWRSPLDDLIVALVTARAPGLLALYGVGSRTAALLLIAAGDHPGRLRSEAAWAHLCGAAPIPASSGTVTRHRRCWSTP